MIHLSQCFFDIRGVILSYTTISMLARHRKAVAMFKPTFRHQLTSFCLPGSGHIDNPCYPPLYSQFAQCKCRTVPNYQPFCNDYLYLKIGQTTIIILSILTCHPVWSGEICSYYELKMSTLLFKEAISVSRRASLSCQGIGQETSLRKLQPKN